MTPALARRPRDLVEWVLARRVAASPVRALIDRADAAAVAVRAEADPGFAAALGLISRDTAPMGTGLLPGRGRAGRLRNRALNALVRRVLLRRSEGAAHPPGR